jgi:hypothetical protein
VRLPQLPLARDAAPAAPGHLCCALRALVTPTSLLRH